MPKESAGILLYKFQGGELRFFLVHPGGPYWDTKDAHVWSIPKGEFSHGEDPLEEAKREYAEETGFEIDGDFLPLTPVHQSEHKIVHAFAVEGDCDADSIRSNTFSIEWPPKSHQEMSFPEVDKADWFDLETAREKILPSQMSLLAELAIKVASD